MAGPVRFRFRRPAGRSPGAPRGAGDGADFGLALALGHISYARHFLIEARDHIDEAVRRPRTEGRRSPHCASRPAWLSPR